MCILVKHFAGYFVHRRRLVDIKEFGSEEKVEILKNLPQERLSDRSGSVFYLNKQESICVCSNVDTSRDAVFRPLLIEENEINPDRVKDLREALEKLVLSRLLVMGFVVDAEVIDHSKK